MIVWLLGFLAHSTLWISLAWAWTRFHPNMHARVRGSQVNSSVRCVSEPKTFSTPGKNLASGMTWE